MLGLEVSAIGDSTLPNFDFIPYKIIKATMHFVRTRMTYDQRPLLSLITRSFHDTDYRCRITSCSHTLIG